MAINILAPGLTLYLSRLVFTDAPGGGQRQSPPVRDVGRITLPWLSDWLGEIEDKGWFFVSDLAGIMRGFCTNLSLLSVLAAVLIGGTGFCLADPTRPATAVGRRGAVRRGSSGVNVYRYKYIAVHDLRGLAGLAGAFLVVGLKFQDGQTGGRGFIGLAAMIFGNWRPGGMAMGAGLFGYTDGVQQYDSPGSAMHAFLILVARGAGRGAGAAVPVRSQGRSCGRRRDCAASACGGSPPRRTRPSNW